jgi:hypothetical protein
MVLAYRRYTHRINVQAFPPLSYHTAHICNTLNKFKSSSGRPWNISEAFPGLPEYFKYPMYYPRQKAQFLCIIAGVHLKTGV